MTIIQIEYKKFSEWDEETQEIILDNHRLYNVNYDYWHEDTMANFIEIAAIFGLNIDQIFFSGFSSQGDGACFTGSYCYKKGAVKTVKETYPNWTELHEIVEALQKLQSESFYSISTYARHRGRYYHSNCIDFETDIVKGCMSKDHIETFEQVLRGFADLIYRSLEEEYYYLTSDESLKEYFTDCELEFNKTGSIL